MPRTNRSGTSEKGPKIGELLKMFSGGVKGGEFTPETEEITTEWDEASMGKEAPPNVVVKPGSFSRAEATNPFMDAITGGQNSAMAAQMNAQAGMAQYQAEVAAKENLRRIEAEKEIAASNNAARSKDTRFSTWEAPVAQKFNVSPEALTQLFTKLNPSNIGFASNEADARFMASQNPAFKNVVQDRVFAEQQALPIEVRSKGAIQAPSNTDVYTPRVGYDMFPNQKISGPFVNQRLIEHGGYTLPNGQVIGAKMETINERSPGRVVDLDAAQRREAEIRQELSQAAEMKQKMEAEEAMRAKTAFAVPSETKVQVKPSVIPPAEDTNSPGMDAILKLLQKLGLNKGISY